MADFTGGTRRSEKDRASEIPGTRTFGTAGMGQLSSVDPSEALRKGRSPVFLCLWLNELPSQLPLVQGLAEYVSGARFYGPGDSHA